jgi:hypothetical protein
MLGDLFDPCGDAVRMLRPHRLERPKDDEIERALQELDAGWFST